MHCSLERLKKEPELLQADQDQLNRQAQVNFLGCSFQAIAASAPLTYACARSPCSPCGSQFGRAQHASL